MAQVLVRNLDDAIRDRLRERAQRHGHSMEEEIRQILRAAAFESSRRRNVDATGAADCQSDGDKLGDPAEIGLGTWMRRRIRGIGLRSSEQIAALRGGEPTPPSFASERGPQPDHVRARKDRKR